MTHEAPPQDARHIWQNQKREYPNMSVQEIRIKANTAHRKARKNIIVTLVFAVLLMIFCTIAIAELPGPPRMITGAMMVVVLIVAIQTHKRIVSAQPLSPDAPVSACIEFYRKELESQYRTRTSMGSVVLTWRFAVVLVIYAWLTWSTWVRSIGPLAVRILLPSLLVLILIVRHIEARKIKRELRALSDFEKQNVQAPLNS